VEYPELQSLNHQVNYKNKYTMYLSSPKCLFYARKDGQLVPIAITLQSTNQCKAHSEHVIWTPRDDENDWLLAKMWVKMADAQYHHVISYHLQCLVVLEVFAVATFRHLAAVHPIYKLLHPHLHRVIAVNVLGRQHLHPAHNGMFERFLGAGQQYQALLRQAYTNFSLDALHLPTDLKERGVDDKNSLPGYYFRDDGLKLWEIIKKYVRTVIYLHYWSSKNLHADDEVQAWVNELHGEGFVATENGCHGVPTVLRTLEEVIELVTIVIFTASCRSTALTAGILMT
jgi:arachidonate 5-lipoxygenase